MPKKLLRNPDTLSTVDLAAMLGISRHTLINWEKSGKLPAELMPARDEKGKRVWTQKQAEGIKGLLEP